MDSSTVASPFVIDMLKGVRYKGYNVRQILQDNGISPTILEQPKSRVTFAQLASLTLNVIHLLDDETMGLMERPQRLNSFKYACYAMVHAETIGEALRIFCEFYNVLNCGLILSLEYGEKETKWKIGVRWGDLGSNRYAVEHLILILHRTLCWLANSRLNLLSVNLDYPAPAHRSEYRYIFYGAPVFFGQRSCSVVFNNKTLTLQQLRNLKDLKPFLSQMPLTLLSQTIEASDFSAQVRKWLERQLRNSGAVPDIDYTAQHFALHTQALRRRLQKEGSNFLDLKAEMRRDLAINLMNDSDMSIEAIAFQLDFSESSAFIRAFKNWTGLTPLAYRKLSS